MLTAVDRLVVKLAAIRVGSHTRVQDGKLVHVDAYFRDPVSKLKGLAGAWSRWSREKPWDRSAADIRDVHLRMPDASMFGSVRSEGGTALGATAATWEGEHVRLNPRVWEESDSETRRWLLAHEASHSAAADLLANLDMKERDRLLEPFKASNGGFSESALYYPDDDFARNRAEFLADVGATILTFGEDVLQERYRRQAEIEIADPPNPKLVALYAQMTASLKRVGLL
jgi:hypothetical protein